MPPTRDWTTPLQRLRNLKLRQGYLRRWSPTRRWPKTDYLPSRKRHWVDPMHWLSRFPLRRLRMRLEIRW